ncbi:hypothetical protein [Rhodococcus sp. AW25M09]|uniref:hypothetical protein n=1 Tax=Rhodococcus sp. AW25M09 TaxID=1268303 RepID=UPI00034932B5|nr:hypothetical protein [Rhodococcus sp. AW25M09]
MTSHAVDGHYDVLFLGGGNAGVSAAARAIRLGLTDVAVVGGSTPTRRSPRPRPVGDSVIET